MKEEILHSGAAMDAVGDRIDLSHPAVREAVGGAASCGQLWDAVGEDFYVTTPCHSIAFPRCACALAPLTSRRRCDGAMLTSA